MKTKLINLFRNPIVACCTIGSIVGIISVLFFMGFPNKRLFERPSKEDFAEMHIKEQSILENFENVYKLENILISVDEENILIDIISEKSSDYLIRMTFSKEKTLVSTQEISNKTGFENYPDKDYLSLFAFTLMGVTLGVGFGASCGGAILYEIHKRRNDLCKK